MKVKNAHHHNPFDRGKTTSLVKQLVRMRGGQKHHEANFGAILPGAMAKLVAAGLFEPWEGTYRITSKGRQFLKEKELFDALD